MYSYPYLYLPYVSFHCRFYAHVIFPFSFTASFGCCSVSFLIWDRKDKTTNRPTDTSIRSLRSHLSVARLFLSLSPFLENTKFVSRELSELPVS